MNNGTAYTAFLQRRMQAGDKAGFDPIWMPDFLYDFQRSLVEWALRQGRGAIFADCGLGKTPMQLVWAENVIRKTNKPVLIITPLAVSYQTVKEADKFSIESQRSSDGKHGKRIVVTNYQRLHYFDPSDFGGVVCDESSAIKNCNGKTKAVVTEFMRKILFRLLCTATASPNDYIELGTSAEALGHLGYADMLTRFFKQKTEKDHLGWGRTKYRFRGHAEEPFWRWVCSWARACRKPSDLGFDDGRFELPELIEREHNITSSTPRPGMLFSIPAENMQEERQERRITIRERCEAVAENFNNHVGYSVAWCHLNPEGDLLAKMLPDALQVSGSMSDDQKEERLLAFQSGELKQLITKPKIGCFGLNWQHCHNVATFASHSYEQYYQLVRRCWRFGQTQPVTVTTITTEGEHNIMKNLQRKSEQAVRMFDALVANMNNVLKIETDIGADTPERIPAWLA
jgi:hypothetical protein